MSDMNGKIKAVFNWSGGKDSSLALLKALRSGLYDITALLTTVNSAKERSSMHDIPLSLLEKQASSIGIPLYKVPLVPHGDMRDYENAMRQAVLHFRKKGVTHFIFGDIFLHDVMSYRRSQLEPYGITVVEPLWDTGTEEIMDEFLASGLKTVIVTTDASVLGSEYAGREITRNLVDSFPQGCDPCGENGEYHTFCYDGPLFSKPVPFSLHGEPYMRTYPVKLDDGSEKDYSYWFAGLYDPETESGV